MRVHIAIGATMVVFTQCLAFAVFAQTATPPAATSAQPTSTGTVIQAQLNARAPASGRIGGAEADAIYTHYLGGIGRPMVSTTNESTNQSGSSMHGAGSQ